jgi:hypothetical protein
VQNVTDAALIPALLRERDDLETCRRAVRLAMIGPKRECAWYSHGAVLPEHLDGLIIAGVAQLAKEEGVSKLWI